MMLLFLSVYLLISELNSLPEANSPRMVFTYKELTMKRLSLRGNDTPVRLLVEGDVVTVVGRKHLNSFNFQDPQKAPVEKKVLWENCNGASQRDCNYNISVVHKMDEAKVFMCGTNGRETLCCIMSEQKPHCISSENVRNIKESIEDFVIKEGEPSALVFPESAEDAALYITYSGSQEYVGIHKFGKNRVGPATHNKEQHYVGLILSKRKDDSSQNKVYAFYKEKNKDTNLYSEMWLPFVTQVCMADIGGPKNNLQFSWTSQMNARLFCGDPDRRQHFSELIDVATVHADRWQDTRVYALFRNEWGMSAVCVYTIQDIDNIFTKSPFKDDSPDNQNRPRKCVADSPKIHVDFLRMIKETSEMEQWVRPERNLGPLLTNCHSYTHIYTDSLQHKGNNNHPLLFLSLKNGGVHKVTQNTSKAFIIAGYQPFNRTTHIHSIILNPSSRKLYVSSISELVQLDVLNCAKYGDACQGCVLARDPYCGWNGTHCSPVTEISLQDVNNGNHSKCKVSGYDRLSDKAVDSITLPPKSKYFLQCPVTSHHAHYTWHHNDKPASCSLSDQQCLLLIDSMGPEQVGTYKCESEEKGYSKVLAQYQLKLESGSAGRSSSPLVWVCLIAALIKSVSCWS